MNGSVAVVVPAFQANGWLATALRSLAEQTLRPAEVMVVYDGRAADTPAIAARFGAGCIPHGDRGPGAARNAGIAATKAELVAFLDADNWFAPNKLERQVQVLTEQGASVIACDAWLVEDDKVRRTRNHGVAVPAAITMERLVQTNPLVCSTVVARRNSIVQVGGFDEDPRLGASADYDLWLRLAQREPIAYLDEPLAFHSQPRLDLETHSRMLIGIDHMLDKLAGAFTGEAHFEQLITTRRRSVRIELAHDLLAAGKRREARDMVRQACQKSRFSWACLRMWLRTFLPLPPRS